MRGILGTKQGMTQVFTENGKLVPVTVIEVKPNKVVYTRTDKSDGYNSVALAYGEIKAKNVTKPQEGIFKKAGIEPKRYIREIRDMTGYKSGDTIDGSIFTAGEFVDVSGVSKGHGFSGVIKRWNFKIGPMAHGSGYHRGVGSLSMGRGGTTAQSIMKGKKMPGHYGVDNTTVQNLEVVSVDTENNIVLVKGSIPGPKKSLIVVWESIKKQTPTTPRQLVKNN